MKISMIAIAALVAWPAIAVEPLDTGRNYSPTYNACMAAAAGATLQMRDCIGDEQTRWDDALNATYRQLMSKLSAVRQAGLRAEERQWIRRKTHECDHAGDDNAGGTLQAIEVGECTLDQTIRRTLYLRSF